MPTMFDAVTVTNLPAGGDAYAGYGNGPYANIGAIQARFPGKTVLVVDVLNEGIGDFLDIERGDAVPADAPGYVRRRLAAGAKLPGLYGSVSTWWQIVTELVAAGIGRTQVRVWSAHYTGRAHLCDAGCGMPAGWVADLTQYADPGPYDVTLLADTVLAAAIHTPASPPVPPPPPVITDIGDIVAEQITQWISTDSNGNGYADFAVPAGGEIIGAPWADAGDPAETGGYEHPAATVAVGTKIPSGVVRVQITDAQPNRSPGYTVHLTHS
jgi:hypothetical protein